MQFSRQILSLQHKNCGFLLLTREHNVNILQSLRTLCSFNLLCALSPLPLPARVKALTHCSYTQCPVHWQFAFYCMYQV